MNTARISFHAPRAFSVVMSAAAVCLMQPATMAVTITATNTGGWSQRATWDKAVPGDGDTVYIPAGVIVTIDQNVGTPGHGIQNIRINGGKLLVDSAAHTLTFG